MTLVNKIDSNITGLRFAILNPDGTLPANPVWYPLEPNSYDKFGGALKTVARNPINDGRQRKKGVVVDLDADAGFVMDITEDNTQKLMPSFLFAAMRTKVELAVPNVTAAGSVYAPAAGGADYFSGNLMFAKDFTKEPNNGLRLITGTPTGSSVAATGSTLQDENGSSGIISRVGHQFGASVASIDVSGALPKIVFTGIVGASGALTTTGNFADGETVTIGGKVYTFQAALTDVDGHVKVGATAALSLVNLRNAINRNGVGTPGTDFATSTTASTKVTATASSTVLTVTAIVFGTPGNSIATIATVSNASWGAATLTGGTGRSILEFGLIPGEFITVGDDGAGFFFDGAENNGLKRVKTTDNVSITFDKSTLQMTADAGTGKTIRLIFSRINKNEVGPLVVRQLVEFERTLGAPDDGSTDVQAEYLTKSVANQFDLVVKTADKITAKLAFMCADHETNTADDGLKSGSRPVIRESDAFNSSSHVARLSLAAIDPDTATPVDLFAFLLDLTLTIKNNVKPNKAIKVLGSLDNSAGTFQVDAKMTAYFATVEAIRSVRENSDVTLDITFVQANKGVTIDLPLTSLASDGADVKQDQPIELPITSAAASGSKLDANMNHTMMVQYWDYIPDLAA